MISMDMPRSWINLESIFNPDILFLKNDVLIPCFSCRVMINWNGRIKDRYRSIEMGNFVVKTLARMHPKGCFSRLHFCTWTICRLFPSTDWTHFTMNKKIRTSCHMIARAYLRDKLRNALPFLLYHFYPHLPFLFVYMHRLKN